MDAGRLVSIHHPEEAFPAVELIRAAAACGRQFSSKNYQFSVPARVGISVVNALSEACEVNVRRDGQIATAPPSRTAIKLKIFMSPVPAVNGNTGTSVHFWPDESFDSPRFSVFASDACTSKPPCFALGRDCLP